MALLVIGGRRIGGSAMAVVIRALDKLTYNVSYGDIQRIYFQVIPMSTASWQCQGRQYHGYFGSDTCPSAGDDSKSPCANCLNASTDRAIAASIPFLPAAEASMYRLWLAQKQGR